MKRRRLLELASTLPLAPLAVSSLAATGRAAARTMRRVRPGEASWPAPAVWQRLSEDVGGRLVRVVSPLEPCIKAPGSDACTARIEDLQNPYFIGEQAAGTQTTGWLNAWTSSPSVYAVAASNTSDVVAAVNFAREKNLRLVVKGGGHSYQGTSNAPDSLLIWTRAMHDITLHDAFVPDGSSAAPQHAVTIEAGARWLPTYDAVTTKAGRYVQGGGCATVGVAGLIQSGGFGSFSKRYGTAASSLLQAEIVTADGQVRIANASMNSDLFWALKGGGGGSFGVVTKVTLATYEIPEFFGGIGGTIKANSDAAFHTMIGEFVRFYRRSLMNPHFGESISLRPNNTLFFNMVFQGLDQEQAQAIWKPFADFLAASPQDYAWTDALQIHTLPARHWWDPDYRRRFAPKSILIDPRPGASPDNVWWAGNEVECGIFFYAFESIWMPADLLEQPERLAEALFTASRNFEVQLHFNKGLAGAPEDRRAAARGTAMNPAVVDAFALAIIANGAPHTTPGLPGHEPNVEAAQKGALAVKDAANALREVVPGAGAYVSESNFFDPNWQTSYWGPHYPRLLTVKKRYDPDGLFFVHNGVGSEEWSPDGFTRLG